MHDKVVAFALIPLLIVPTPCYLYTWRLALPYVFAGALLVFFAKVPIAGTGARGPRDHLDVRVRCDRGSDDRDQAANTATRPPQPRPRLHRSPTGIANMRSLRKQISAELGRPSGEGRPFALFAMDMDNFKQVNDRFDHSMGDRVLSAIADAICEELQPGDLAVRRGGDEFAVLVPDPSTRDLDALRESLQRAIARARIAICPGSRRAEPSPTSGRRRGTRRRRWSAPTRRCMTPSSPLASAGVRGALAGRAAGDARKRRSRHRRAGTPRRVDRRS